MIAWIDCLGKHWGSYMRHDPISTHTSLWNRQVDLMRTGITSNGTYWNGKPYQYPRHQIPITGMAPDQLQFHRAWKSLTGGNRQDLVWVRYVPHAKLHRKLEVMQMTEKEFFDSLREAQEKIELAIVGDPL